MLAKEKKRTGCSLAIGIVTAGAVAIWTVFQARHVQDHARALIAKCEAAPNQKGVLRICNPEDFTPDSPSFQWEGELKEISDIQERARILKDSWPFRSVAVFGIFCIPLIWYFLLDRIREVSGAVSGRDREH